MYVAQTAARLGLDAGATAPVSAYGSDKNVGYHIGLLVDVRVPESPLGFRIDGAFHELKYSGNATKEQIWMANANLVLKAPTGTMVVPYAIEIGRASCRERGYVWEDRVSVE